MSSCILLPQSSVNSYPYNKNPRYGSGDSSIQLFGSSRTLLFPHGLGPFVVRVVIALLGHDALDASLGQFLFEFLPDKRILVGILYLVFSPVLNLLRMAVELHGRMKGEISRHLAAGVKVLVEPFIGRRNHAALVPRANDFFFAFFPHDRISFAGRYDDRAARPVPVRFLVGFRREDRHMRG